MKRKYKVRQSSEPYPDRTQYQKEKILYIAAEEIVWNYSLDRKVKTHNSTVAPTQPGETRTYLWQIPQRTGPTSKDFECIPWFYYSTVNMVKDLNSGLVGTLIICLKNTGAVIGHHVLHFMIFNENESCNQMHAIDRRMYGNNQDLTFHIGDEVKLYLIGMGSKFDLRFNGHSFENMVRALASSI
uniref:Uncharacterized protein n=1 Tax=Rousettus aegyptiacus TaxID=9407 RepID=A0A7J8HR65_ROUAE|nr:hypothetical protein HJG63_010989 [Rousettus aegyptiacus]